jgi:gamma-glutamyltranspeptidase / glutathione hydrolase
MTRHFARLRRFFAILCALLVCTLAASAAGPRTSSTQEPTRIAPRADTMRPEIIGTHGIVAGGRHYSVAAGIRMLEQGGNAVDAGVATVLAASVVEISHFGFGGEAPTMIYDAKTREVIVINGQGPAPKAATPALFAKEGFVTGNGPLGATLPAMLDAMAIALETKGTMHLEQVMQPAIELADGFPMYEFLQHFLISERKATEQYEWSAKTYYPNGRVPEVG